MSSLARQVARALGRTDTTAAVRPRPKSRFESAAATGVPFEVSDHASHEWDRDNASPDSEYETAEPTRARLSSTERLVERADDRGARTGAEPTEQDGHEPSPIPGRRRLADDGVDRDQPGTAARDDGGRLANPMVSAARQPLLPTSTTELNPVDSIDRVVTGVDETGGFATRTIEIEPLLPASEIRELTTPVGAPRSHQIDAALPADGAASGDSPLPLSQAALQPTEPDVVIRIGRIDVHRSGPAPQRERRPAHRHRRNQSLDDWLGHQDSRGERS